MKNEEIKSEYEILHNKINEGGITDLTFYKSIQAMKEYASQFITSKDKEIEASRNTLLEEIKVLAKKNSDLKKYIQTLEEGWIDQIKTLQKENQTLKTAVGNLEMLLDGDGLKNKQTIEKLTDRWDDLKKWIENELNESSFENSEDKYNWNGQLVSILHMVKQKITELQNKF